MRDNHKLYCVVEKVVPIYHVAQQSKHDCSRYSTSIEDQSGANYMPKPTSTDSIITMLGTVCYQSSLGHNAPSVPSCAAHFL